LAAAIVARNPFDTPRLEKAGVAGARAKGDRHGRDRHEEDGEPGGSRVSFPDFLVMAGLVVAWVALQTWVLPRLGVRT
jgi:hypothetical protein